MFTLSYVLVRVAWWASGRDKMDKVLTFHLRSYLESWLSLGLCPLKCYLLWVVFGKSLLIFTVAAFPAVATRFYSSMFLGVLSPQEKGVLLEVPHSIVLDWFLTWNKIWCAQSRVFILSLCCLKGNWRFLAFVYDGQRELPETGSYSLSVAFIHLMTVFLPVTKWVATCISSLQH